MLKCMRSEGGFKKIPGHRKKMQFLDRIVLVMFTEEGTCKDIKVPSQKIFRDKINDILKIIEGLLTTPYSAIYNTDREYYPKYLHSTINLYKQLNAMEEENSNLI